MITRFPSGSGAGLSPLGRRPRSARSLKERAERLWQVRRLLAAGAIDALAAETALTTLAADDHPRIAALALATAADHALAQAGAPVR